MSRAPLARQLQALVARRGTSAANEDGGFALVEVLVGMVILAIVVAGSTLGVLSGIKSTSTTQNRVSAANLAQQAIQQAEALPRATLASATPVVTAATSASPYTVTRTVTFFPSAKADGTAVTACPTTITPGTPYGLVVHVQVSGAGEFARTVTMDTVVAC